MASVCLTVICWVPICLIFISVILITATGCSKQAVSGPTATAGTGQLPFDRVSDTAGITPTDGFVSDEIPAGTEVTILLRLALSSADSRPGDSFQAILDEPIVVAGQTVLPRGALVSGTVVAAKAGGHEPDPGYLRVTLSSIAVNGKPIPLQTSSIFAKGRAYGGRRGPQLKRSAGDAQVAAAQSAMGSGNGSEPRFNPGQSDVRFSTDRRLTFRLAQPLHLHG